jgi:hypothetical protein
VQSIGRTREMTSPTSNGEYTVTISGYTYDAGEAAYKILNEIFLWFGVETDKVPYSAANP